MKILLVDDDFFFQKTLSFYLEDMGHNVFFAQNGQKALDFMKENIRVDLIICDLDMPVLTGDSFITSMEEIYRDKRPVIVVVSGMKDGLDFLKKSKITYDYYFKKPMDVNVFGETLAKISV